MGVFHVFYIVQMVPNGAKHLVYWMSYSTHLYPASLKVFLLVRKLGSVIFFTTWQYFKKTL